MRYVLDMRPGPGTVGPFDDRAEAERWAEVYVSHVSELNPSMAPTWVVVEVVEPAHLVWWDQ